MKAIKPKYPIDQCALYKCKTRKKLEALLTIEPGGLRNIQHAIKYHSFEIDKTNSNEKRKISAPGYTLKAVQNEFCLLFSELSAPTGLFQEKKAKVILTMVKPISGPVTCWLWT